MEIEVSGKFLEIGKTVGARVKTSFIMRRELCWPSGPLSEGRETPGRIGLRLSVDLWSVFPYPAMPQEWGCLQGPDSP